MGCHHGSQLLGVQVGNSVKRPTQCHSLGRGREQTVEATAAWIGADEYVDFGDSRRDKYRSVKWTREATSEQVGQSKKRCLVVSVSVLVRLKHLQR